jgi:hypothetical protein
MKDFSRLRDWVVLGCLLSGKRGIVQVTPIWWAMSSSP